MRKGFTLVEVLVTSALLLLLTGILVSVWMACRPAMTATDARLTTQNQLREAMIRVTQCLRTAQAPAEGAAVLQPALNAEGEILEFYSCDVLAGPDRPLQTRAPERFTYRVARRSDGGVWLEMLNSSGSLLAERRLARNVLFSYRNQDNVAIRIVANATTPSQDVRGFRRDAVWQIDTVVSVPYTD